MPLTPKQSGKKQRTTTRAKAIRTVNSPSIKTEHALSPAIHPPNPSEGQSTPPSSARRAFATTSDLVDLRARLEQAEALVARIPSQLLKPPILASTPVSPFSWPNMTMTERVDLKHEADLFLPTLQSHHFRTVNSMTYQMEKRR